MYALAGGGGCSKGSHVRLFSSPPDRELAWGGKGHRGRGESTTVGFGTHE